MPTSYYGGDFSPSLPDYSLADPLSHTYDDMFFPELSHLSSTPFSFQFSESFSHAKLQTLIYSTSSTQLPTHQSYPYPTTRRHLLASNRSDLSSDDSVCREPRGRCPYPDCGKVFKGLKAHLFAHSKERPEKCPIVTCEYHIKGFCRKYDKHRHTLTHYKGTMACSFCPVSAAKTFNRADVFKRHLLSVHGAKHAPPPTGRKSFNSIASIPSMNFSDCAPAAQGICSVCRVHFQNPQDFYNHLDDCIISCVSQPASIPPARIGQKIPIENTASANKRTRQSRSSSQFEKIPEDGREYDRGCCSAPELGVEPRRASWLPNLIANHYYENTDPRAFADDLIRASSVPASRLKRSASSISKMSNLRAAEEEEKKYKAMRPRSSATAANHVANSVAGKPRFGKPLKDDMKLFDQQGMRMPLIERSSHIKELDTETLNQAHDLQLKQWSKEQKELVALEKSKAKSLSIILIFPLTMTIVATNNLSNYLSDISRPCPDVPPPSTTSRESAQLKYDGIYLIADWEKFMQYSNAPAEIAPLLPPEMTANQDIACKHEESIDITESKPTDPKSARTASLLQPARPAIQDVAFKQELSELHIKKDIDLTLPRYIIIFRNVYER
jgi:hypothetical protein